MKINKPALLLGSAIPFSIAARDASDTVEVRLDGFLESILSHTKEQPRPSIPSIYDYNNWIDDEVEWMDLSGDQREFLTSRRWTQRLWDCGADEESLHEWHELSPERQRVWRIRGWDEERWNNEDMCHIPMKSSTPEDFNPIVINITVPQLNEITMEHLKEYNTEIRLVRGNDAYKNEEFNETIALGDFIARVGSGKNDLYMHLEENMREKKHFQRLVGDRVKEHLLAAVMQHNVLTSEGIWKPEWGTLDEDSYDWAMFIGAEGSSSPLHYDSDIFNFLYLVEGRKRIVIIPNDERTKGTFETDTNEDGGTGWGAMNVLDRSVPLPPYAVEMEIGPGQGIAIPYVAWHAVENLETSLAFSLRIVD